MKKALEESFQYRSPWAAYLITQHLEDLKHTLDPETLKALSDIAIKNDDSPLLEILENNRKSEEKPALMQDFTEGYHSSRTKLGYEMKQNRFFFFFLAFVVVVI